MKRIVIVLAVIVLALSVVPSGAQDRDIPECDLTMWELRGSWLVVTNFFAMVA